MNTHLMRPLVLSAAIASCVFAVHAAEPEIKGTPAELAAYLSSLPGSVQIVGEGEIKTPADRAIVSLRIESENKSLAEAIKANQSVRAKLATFLKEQGMGADRIQPAPFSSTQKQAVFSDKVKSHKVNTLLKVTTHNEQEFQSATRAVDQFTDVAYVRAEFEHSDKDALKSRASAKACEDAERQKRIYEEKLGVKLVPRNIQDQKQFAAPVLRPSYRAFNDSAGTYKAGGVPRAPSVEQAEASEEETPFGELIFTARVLVEYAVERK